MKTSQSLSIGLLLAATSCASPQPEVKVREIAATGESYGVRDAEAQLALGNVGLALEGFRKVLRDDPQDIAALVGMAHCYDSMGRFDLSRRWYETALASAPDDAAVLGNLAASLDAQGKASEAASVRAEIAANAAAAMQVEKAAAIDEEIVVIPESGQQVALLPAAPPRQPAEVGIANAPPVGVQTAAPSLYVARVAVPPAEQQRQPAEVGIANAPPVAMHAAAPNPQVARVVLPPAEQPLTIASAPVSTPASVAAAASVTVRLPAPTEAVQVAAAQDIPAPADSAKPAERPIPIEEAVARADGPSPHLERLSLGEVALVTRSQPIWTAQLVSKTAQSATYRWVPVRPVARLLNAARSQGLAARTRAHLAERGWKRIEIGDAPAVRQKTVVLYPAFRRGTAVRLAKQFGFSELRPFKGNEIVVLLGRDAAAMKILRPA